MRRGLPLKERLRSKIRVNEEGCWVWTGTKNPDGYGKISIGRGRVPVYRVMWILIRGPIPEGLVLDHLCRNPACCNPDHLEPVTQKVNILRGESPSARNARKTVCKRGHPFDGQNTYRWRGGRFCRACARIRGRERRERLKRTGSLKKAS